MYRPLAGAARSAMRRSDDQRRDAVVGAPPLHFLLLWERCLRRDAVVGASPLHFLLLWERCLRRDGRFDSQVAMQAALPVRS